MKIKVNNLIPFKGYLAINLFGVLFIRKENAGKIDRIVINHEEIHTEQMKEMLYIFFYIWYFIEWLIKLFIHFNGKTAYRNISFEQEAFYNENTINYIEKRKPYSWLKYVIKTWK